MIIEPPKTLKDFQEIKESILELMANPYCDHQMFLNLSEKIKKVEEKIKEIQNK